MPDCYSIATRENDDDPGAGRRSTERRRLCASRAQRRGDAIDRRTITETPRTARFGRGRREDGRTHRGGRWGDRRCWQQRGRSCGWRERARCGPPCGRRCGARWQRTAGGHGGGHGARDGLWIDARVSWSPARVRGALSRNRAEKARSRDPQRDKSLWEATNRPQVNRRSENGSTVCDSSFHPEMRFGDPRRGIEPSDPITAERNCGSGVVGDDADRP